MTRVLMCLLSVLGVAVLIGLPGMVWASVIDVDGWPDDWAGKPFSYDGPDGSNPPEYDIDTNWAHWGLNVQGRHMWFFMVQQRGPMQNKQLPDKVDVLFDLRPGGGLRSGISGVDMYMTFNLDNAQHALRTDIPMFYYTPGGSLVTIGNIGWASWGDNASGTKWQVELGFDPTNNIIQGQFGQLTEIYWMAYLTNGLSGSGKVEDWCPSEGWDYARIPEPGTVALFGLGLLGVAVLRRRRA